MAWKRASNRARKSSSSHRRSRLKCSRGSEHGLRREVEGVLLVYRWLVRPSQRDADKLRERVGVRAEHERAAVDEVLNARR